MAVTIEAGREYKDGHGNKRGPMKPEREWFVDDRGWGYYRDGQRMAIGHSLHLDHIVSEWDKSPIRTVTRRELVPGVYGVIFVDQAPPNAGNKLDVKFKHTDGHTWYDANDLRSAAMVLSQLAEFLDEDKGDE